ncbi:cytochrome P450, partial [Auricularia subglabra TFB-10046 SS5]
LLVSFIACVAVAVRRLFFSTTSAIPGPWYTKVSRLYLAYQEFFGRHCEAIDSLFSRYGPVVCVAPGVVLFTLREDYKASKIVYSSFPKVESYTSFRMHDIPSVDNKGHLVCRRRVHTFWLPSNLAQFREDLQSCVAKFVGMISSNGGRTPLDALELSHHLMASIDLMALVVLGEQLGALDGLVDGRRHVLCEPTRDFISMATLRNVLPKWTWRFLKQVPIARWRRFCSAGEIIVADVVRRHAGLEGQRESLLNHLVATSRRSAEPITEIELVAECSDHFIAGADFLSTMLAFSLAHLGRQPEFTRRLREEVLSTDPNNLDGAPFLSAFVKEALRMYASAPGPLLRIVPSTRELKLSGHAIPAGAAIGVQALSSHFDHQVFQDPETFVPDRWIDAKA